LFAKSKTADLFGEVSQDWNTHNSYAADGTTVETVILEAKAHGMLPAEMIRAT